MKRSPLIFGLGASVISVSACATPVGAVRQTVASAPEWYQEARVEIRGEGYPDVSRVVSLERDRGGDGATEATRLAVADAEADLLRSISAAPADEALQEALAWAASEQSAFAGLEGRQDFLSEADIAALRALFDVRRAQP